MNTIPKISLICATKGRRAELGELLHSLCSQEYSSFEVIIVDQNAKGFIDDVIQRFTGKLTICHLPFPGNGAAKARNYGIKRATGAVLGFPDDDCQYPPAFLRQVMGLLCGDGSDVICGRCIDPATNQDSAGRYSHDNVSLTLTNLWTRHILISMFFKRQVIDAVGDFDENLGVGTHFGSGEETDLLLRSLYGGFHCRYDAGLVALHPDPTRNDSDEAINRAYSYGLGLGALFHKHVVGFGQKGLLAFYGYSLLRTLGGMGYGVLRGDFAQTRFYFMSLKGRIKGWREWNGGSEPC